MITFRNIAGIASGTAFFVCTLVLGGAEAARKPDLTEFLSKSDAVVEGTVTGIRTVAARSVPVRIEQADESLVMEVGGILSVSFRVEKVFGGSLSAGDTIEIYVYPDLPQEKSELMQDGHYVLILKKHKVKDGFHVAGWGRASWFVFEVDGRSKIKSWEQPFEVRKSEDYLDYDEFKEGLLGTLQHQGKL